MEAAPGPGQEGVPSASSGLGPDDVNDDVGGGGGCVSDGAQRDGRKGEGLSDSAEPPPRSEESSCGRETPGAQTLPEQGGVALGYVTGRLTEACRNVGQHVLTTRSLVEKAAGAHLAALVSQYLPALSAEPPLTETRQPGPPPDPGPRPPPHPGPRARRGVGLVDLSAGGLLRPGSTVPGSVSSSGASRERPQTFSQRLVELPPALSRLQAGPAQQSGGGGALLDLLDLPGAARLLASFWLHVANRQHPRPRPAGLLLLEEDVYAVAAAGAASRGPDPETRESPAVFHHLRLEEITEVQVSLGGQHVRLLSAGGGNASTLAVFTYSPELSQELCRALLRRRLLCGPELDAALGHPLLRRDLAGLSLDWTAAGVPDLALSGGGLRLTSRFKRALADLLYVVHGNMEEEGRPPLAHVAPLLLASVRAEGAAGGVVQLLLTDTHLALLRQDGGFHPVEPPRGRGSWDAPPPPPPPPPPPMPQPQFRGVAVRPRARVRGVRVGQADGCLEVEVVFAAAGGGGGGGAGGGGGGGGAGGAGGGGVVCNVCSSV